MFRNQKCPCCQQFREIAPWLKVCFKCAYPKFNRYYWKDAKVGDKVYLSGNRSQGSTLIPTAYGAHTIHDVEKRELRSSAKGGTNFQHYEDSLLSKKG